MTPTVTSWNRYTISIENKFAITEFLPCVRQFGDQNTVFLHEQVSVSLDKREALCILMQYEIELMNTFGIIAFSFICIIFSFAKSSNGRHSGYAKFFKPEKNLEFFRLKIRRTHR